MPRVLRPLALFLLIFATGRFVQGETITFDDIGANVPPTTLGSYEGFTYIYFDLFSNVNIRNIPGFVRPPGVTSGTQAITASYYPFQACCYPYFLPYGPNTFAFFYDTTGAVFTLNSLELTSDTTVQILGLRQGVVVDQMFIATDDLNEAPVLATLNWSGVDAVGFPGIVGQHYLELDDITITEAPVPEPTSIVLLGSGILGLAAVARRQRRT